MKEMLKRRVEREGRSMEKEEKMERCRKSRREEGKRCREEEKKGRGMEKREEEEENDVGKRRKK